MFEKLLNPRISCYTLNFFNTSANNCHSCSHFCRAKCYTLNFFNMSGRACPALKPRQAAEPPLLAIMYYMYYILCTREICAICAI